MFAAKRTLQRIVVNQQVASVARSSVNFAAIAVQAQRPFSSFSQVSSGASKLSKALEKEIKYENENYSQLEDIETFLNDSGFVFSE